MYVRLQQPNVVPSSSRPWSNFRPVGIFPGGTGATRPPLIPRTHKKRALSKRRRRLGVPRFLMGAASAASRADNQARSKLPGEPALAKRRSRQRRCFIRGARAAALALSSIISLSSKLGQPKIILEDHAVAMHCDALHERSLAAPQPSTTTFAGTKRGRSNIRGSPGRSGSVATGSERDGG